MTPQQFDALVERLSARAARHPRLYRLQVFGLAVLGYAYLSIVLLVALALSIGLGVLCLLQPLLLVKLIKIIWLPVLFAWTILRALWVRIDPPTGQTVTRAAAPRLFDEIDAIRAQMNAPALHTVLLTSDYNAGVVQTPRLGVLGWPRNYLLLGLPMLAALSLDQFRAVLAHEFGHLCAGDSRMAGRLYQQRIMWLRLQAQFEARRNWAIQPFLTRFAPYFNAYSFVLARAQEYAADAASVQVVSREATAQALVVAQLGAEYQATEVWQPLLARTKLEEQPSMLPFATLVQNHADLCSWKGASEQLADALKRETDWSDTHPSLSDRLKAIGMTPDLPPCADVNAAQALLGERAMALAEGFDATWKIRNANAWREQYRQNLVNREQLAAIEQAAAQGPLDKEQLWQLAYLSEQVHGVDPARPHLRAFHDAYPSDPRGLFALGKYLLADGDDAGLALLDQAMDSDGDAIKPGAELAYGFLMRHGRKDQAARYRSRWTDRNALEQLAERERATAGPKDQYDPPDLAPAQVQVLQEGLRRLRYPKKALLVKKRLRYLPEKPLYLLLVRKRIFARISDDAAAEQVRHALGLGSNVLVAVYNRKLARLWKTVTRVPRADILAR